MIDPVEIVRNSVVRSLWKIDVAEVGRGKAFATRVLRYFYLIVRGTTETRLTIRAASLVYTTILSLVPLMAVSFALLKSFGVQSRVEPILYDYLAPLGPEGRNVADKINSYVANISSGVLGSVGLGFLLYTVVSAAQKVEEAFNTIWGILAERTLLQKIRDYTSIVILGPVFAVIAVGLTASFTSTIVVQKILSYGPILYTLSKLVPYFIICAVFSILYSVFPNTNVDLTAALTGGFFAGVLWEFAGHGFASFVATSGQYPAIYLLIGVQN